MQLIALPASRVGPAVRTRKTIPFDTTKLRIWVERSLFALAVAGAGSVFAFYLGAIYGLDL